ncbi:MAG TPA: hypothetical protein VGB13_08385 [Candidatus Krumholzibacteria bacterium]
MRELLIPGAELWLQPASHRAGRTAAGRPWGERALRRPTGRRQPCSRCRSARSRLRRDHDPGRPGGRGIPRARLPLRSYRRVLAVRAPG